MEALAFTISEAGKPQIGTPGHFLDRVTYWLDHQVGTQGTSSPVEIEAMHKLHDFLQEAVERLA